MEELRQQTRDVLDGKPAQPKIFPMQVRWLEQGCSTAQECRRARAVQGFAWQWG